MLMNMWGLEYAGLSSLFSSIMSVLSLGEMGIGEALIFSMYKPAAEHDTIRINALLLVYKRIYSFIGIIVLTVGVGLIPFLPHLISGTYPDNIKLVPLYIIYLIQVSGNYLFWSYYMSVFRTHQSLYITYKWRTVVFLIMYGVQIGIIILSDNYYLFALCPSVCTILVNFIDYCLTRKYYPEYRPCGKVENSFFKDLIRRVKGMAIRKFRNSVRGSFDSLVISGFLGLVILAKYQNYILVTAVFILIYNVFNGGILQSLGNSNVLETKDSNQAVISLYSFITQWIAIWFSALFLNLIHPFMEVWAGVDATFDTDIEVMFTIYFYLTFLTYISEMIRNSTGLWAEGKWIPLVESVANLVLNIIFVQFWGVRGILVATILTLAFINIPFETMLVYKLHFGKSAINELMDYIVNGVLAIIVIFISHKLCLLYEGNKISVLAVKILISTLVPNLAFLILHAKDSRLRGVLDVIWGLIRENEKE
jgi:O-antigen/teichoic acid export membrane protein